jgi:hypothetical protein
MKGVLPDDAFSNITGLLEDEHNMQIVPHARPIPQGLRKCPLTVYNSFKEELNGLESFNPIVVVTEPRSIHYLLPSDA